MSYRRPKSLCIRRARGGDETAWAPPTPEQIERMLSIFRDPRREEAAEADERAMLAEDRQALGLTPMRARR